MLWMGIDIGYRSTKVFGGNGYGDAQRALFPSVVGSPDGVLFSLDGEKTLEMVEPHHYLVGQAAIEQSRFDLRRQDRGWVWSKEWETLLYAGISELVQGTVEACVVLGLPVKFYLADKDAVREKLLGKHAFQRSGRNHQTIGVSDARVLPQGWGISFNEIADDQGQLVNAALAKNWHFVMDFGSKTTNLVGIGPGCKAVSAESDSVLGGGWDIVSVARYYLEREAPGLELKDHEVEACVIEREAWDGGKRLDLTDVVEPALDQLYAKVKARAGQLWNGAGKYRVGLVAGGLGAAMFPRVKADYAQARLVQFPEWANVLGFGKFARRVAK